MNKTLQLLSLVFVVGVIVLGYWYFGASPNIDRLKESVAPTASLYPEAKYISESLDFIDNQSKAVHLSEALKGKWGLLYFGFTSCPDVCPVDLAKISQSYKTMKNKDRLQVVFISVDPKRDIGNLDSYTQTFDESFIGLTAHNDKLTSISKALGVYHQVVETQQDAQQDHSEHSTDSHDDRDMDSHDSHDKASNSEMKSMTKAQYNIDHTTSFLLLSPDLKLTAILTSPHEPKAMAEALDKIIDVL